MIIEIKVGKAYADFLAQKHPARMEFMLLRVFLKARQKGLNTQDLLKKIPSQDFINRKGTYAFLQRSYPLWINVFLKQFMLRSEFLPIKDIKTEDSFVLNIWTESLEGKKPVIVFIHGGGEGSGTVPVYTMDNLAKQGFVCVSITYRIGNFGYMPTWKRDKLFVNLAYFDQ